MPKKRIIVILQSDEKKKEQQLIVIVIFVICYQPMADEIFETSSRIRKKLFAGNHDRNSLINSCLRLK